MEEGLRKKMHVAMYPWLAFGHITPFLLLANKLAKRGHKVSFFLPNKAIQKLASQNHYPHLITFISIPIPPVDGLSEGVETTADIPFGSQAPLMDAMDLTQPFIESYLTGPQGPVDLFYIDYAFWLPSMARKYGVKSVFYVTCFISQLAYMCPLARGLSPGQMPFFDWNDLKESPPGFPSSSVLKLRTFEARLFDMVAWPRMRDFYWRLFKAIEECDAICYKSCREMEGEWADFLERHHKKPVLSAGPMVPELPDCDHLLDESLDGWLKDFETGSVVYCALGSESVLYIDELQELTLGLELTGKPFFAVLKVPKGYETIESALPPGFIERTKNRGKIHCGWVQQQLILNHPSVGCFVTHCGGGSLTEALVSDCQMVLMPYRADQFSNARLMGGVLRVGIEVEKGEDDSFVTKEAVCKAIMTVTDSQNEVGNLIRDNHAKWREFLLSDGLEESYISSLVENLECLIPQASSLT